MRADQVIAFFPLQPATLGHTLVVPTSHIPDIWALDDDIAFTLAHATMRVARAVGEALSPALVVFGFLDGQYLHTEKRFRDLYAAILRNEVEPLSMDTTPHGARRRRDTYGSWSVLGFYGPLALAGLLLMVVAILRGDVKQDRPPDAHALGSATSISTPGDATR
jgi:hypothetical protein